MRGYDDSSKHVLVLVLYLLNECENRRVATAAVAAFWKPLIDDLRSRVLGSIKPMIEESGITQYKYYILIFNQRCE